MACMLSPVCGLKTTITASAISCMYSFSIPQNQLIKSEYFSASIFKIILYNSLHLYDSAFGLDRLFSWMPAFIISFTSEICRYDVLQMSLSLEGQVDLQHNHILHCRAARSLADHFCLLHIRLQSQLRPALMACMLLRLHAIYYCDDSISFRVCWF